MAKIANLSADLVANTATFEADLKRADRALNSSQAQWGRALKNVDKQFGSLGGGIKGVAGELFSVKGAFAALIGTIGAGSILKLAKDAVDAVGGLGEMAAQLGVTTDTLQAFQYAASQVGLNSEEMQTGLGKLTRTIGDAAEGSKSAIDAFDKLGIGVLDSSGNVRSTEEIIREVADALQGIDDPARRASIAVDLFGKAGQKMLPFLENGARGIDDLVTQAASLGLIFDEGIIRGADEASDKLATLSKVLGTQMTAALVELAPLLTAAADGILRVAKETRLWFEMFKGDEFKSLDALDEKLQNLLAERDRLLQQEADVGDSFLDGLFGADDARKSKLAGIKADITRIKGLIDPLMLVQDAPPSTGTGSYNPPATGGTAKKSPAEVQSEKLAKTIADLQLQVDTFNMGEVDTKIAEAIAGIDQSLPGAKEAVTAISSLIQQLGLLKQARDDDAADVTEYDKIIAETDAAWQKRLADGKAIMESVRTPAEAYAAQIGILETALAAGTISQEAFNRAVKEAKDALDEAEGTGFDFREMADEAAGALASGITDAVFEADSLNDALKEIVKTLGKMLLQKMLLKAFDIGLDALFGTSATGGPEGGLTLVGERGPELVDLPAGSYVNTAKASSSMMGQRVASSNIGGGGMVINNNITVEKGGGTSEQNADVAQKIQDALEQSMRQIARDEIINETRQGNTLNQSPMQF